MTPGRRAALAAFVGACMAMGLAAGGGCRSARQAATGPDLAVQEFLEQLGKGDRTAAAAYVVPEKRREVVGGIQAAGGFEYSPEKARIKTTIREADGVKTARTTIPGRRQTLALNLRRVGDRWLVEGFEFLRELALKPKQIRALIRPQTTDRVARILGDLEAFGPRAVGCGNLKRTADYLERELAAAGLEVLARQPFEVAVPVDAGSHLAWRGPDGRQRRARVHAVWPNRTIPPFVPAEGLESNVVHVGAGELPAFDGKPVDGGADGPGAIVLMDYHSAVHWQTAAMLGAGAVVFLPDPHATKVDNYDKFSTSPVQVPRFYLDDPEAAEALVALARRVGRATLTGGMTWRNVTCENLFALLPATDQPDQAETLMVAVRYDAASVVPGAAGGGQSASTLAGALAAVAGLADPNFDLPRKQNLLVFFEGARSMCYAGSRALSGVLRDVHARMLADHKAGKPVSEHMEIALKKLGRMRPWLDDRLRLYRIRRDRFAAAVKWLEACREEIRPFAYQDPEPVSPSALVELADARDWLAQFLRDRVKQQQIVVLATLNERERALGVSAFAPAEEVPAEIRRLRRRKEYYRALAARQKPPALLRAIRDYRIDPNVLAPEDVTAARLLAVCRDRLTREQRRADIYQRWADLRPTFRRLRVTRQLVVDLSAASNLLTLTRGRYLGGLQTAAAGHEWAWVNGAMTSQTLERLVFAAHQDLGVSEGVFRFTDTVTFQATRKVGAQGPWGRTSYAEGREGFNVNIAQAGVSGATLVTANDPRTHRLGPGDRVRTDPEALANLQMQARTVSLLLAQALNKPRTIVHTEKHLAGATNILGKVVKKDIRSGPFPKLPVSGCVVRIPPSGRIGRFAGSVFHERYALTGPDGLFAFDSVPLGAWAEGSATGRMEVEAFRASPVNGMVAYAPDASMKRRGGYDTRIERTTDDQFIRLVVFDGASIQAYGAIDPMLFFPLSDAPKLLEGRGGGIDEWYVSVPKQGQPFTTLVATVPKGTEVKVVMPLAGYGNRMMLIGDQSRRVEGSGYDVGDGLDLTLTVPRVARSLYRLNDARIADLEARGVRSAMASRLHALSGEDLEAMDAALRSRAYSKALAVGRGIWGRELRAYPEVRGLVDEAVVAAVIVLALLAPWAVFMERLILKSGSIHGRILGSAGFFTGGFALLFLLHPAFQITATPIVILIAYALALLALLAFGVILKKYAAVMKRWSERVGGVHSSDISRTSAFMIAFNLGLTNMAKRPLRTGLTVVMIALLAFSVMTFTSVATVIDMRLVPVSADRRVGYDGVLFRLYEWRNISDSMAEAFEASLPPEIETARRIWYQRTELGWNIGIGRNKLLFTRRDTGDSHIAECCQGFLPSEKAFSGLHRCVTGSWFTGAYDEAILPTAAAEALGIGPRHVTDVSPNEQVRIRYGDQDFRVIGLLDTEAADQVVDVSGTPLSYLDFPASGFEPRTLGKGETKALLERMRAPVGDEYNATFKSFDRGVLLSYDFVRDLGGHIKNIVAKFPPGADSRRMLDSLMTCLQSNVYASLDGRPHLVKTVNAQSFQGVWKMILPVVLVVLIMVNAMLGTVDERLEEIKMLGAVGLAPKHVTILYVAESCVYGVLGVVFGVLLGLSVAWLTGGMDLGLDVNYASVPTILMGLGVLAIVVLATLIPASRAAKLSTPSGAGEWKLEPSAAGDTQLRLPFTVTRDNGVGIFAFLHEYLDGHWESTSPDFRCAELLTRIQPRREDAAAGDGDTELAITGRIWLAPYDMRVSQDVRIVLSQQGDAPLYQITYSAARLTGELNAWHRANFAFVDRIRQQLLIYRTLRDEQKADYLRRAAAIFQPAKDGDLA
jgi:hypothetical protein